MIYLPGSEFNYYNVIKNRLFLWVDLIICYNTSSEINLSGRRQNGYGRFSLQFISRKYLLEIRMEKKQINSVWPDDLLITKLNIPSSYFKVVRRNRLTDLFYPEMDSPLVTVVAPAGYGKTTFMVDCLSKFKDTDWEIVWLSLDSLDNSPLRFWSYIIAGLNKDTALSFSSANLIQQGFTSECPSVINPIINSIATYSHPIMLVIDDYHLITDESIHQSISYLINHQPANLHIIILSRKNIPIPLSKQKAECKLLEITSCDLAFTLPESKVFLSNTMDLNLDNEQVLSLYNATEGWIAGIQLYAISIHGKTDFQFIHKLLHVSKHQISEYLINEVLNQQEKSVKEFLIQSSILTELSPGFCDEVLSRHDSQEMLTKIMGANLFIISIDEDHQWYRYHPLFAQALKDHLEKTNPDLIQQINRKAYIWLNENRYSDKAVTYAISAGDLEKAAEIIENCALQAIIRSDTTSLVRWINQISEDLLLNRPGLMLYNALAGILLNRLDMINPELEKLEKVLKNNTNLNFTEEEKNVIEWKIAAIRSVMLTLRGEYGTAILKYNELLDKIPGIEPYFQGFVINSLSEAYVLAEEYDLGLSNFNKAKEFSLNNGLRNEYINECCELGRIYKRQGKITEAKQLYLSTLDYIYLTDAKYEVIAYVKSGLMEIELIQNDLAAAQKLAAEVTGIFSQSFLTGYPWLYQSIILIRLAQYNFSISKLEATHSYFDWVDKQNTSGKWTANRLIEGFVQLQTDIWISEKKYKTAENWLSARILDSVKYKVSATDEKFGLCKVYLAQSKYRPAIPILSELESYLDSKGMKFSLIEVLIIQSMAYRSIGNVQKSIQSIKKAIDLAEPENIISLFIKEGIKIKEILMDFVNYQNNNGITENSSYSFILSIISHVDITASTESNSLKAADEHSKKSMLQYLLTSREIGIFEKLLGGESVKDIAAEYMISSNTVKAHIRNIYKKLNIHNRRDAFKWIQNE